LPIYPLTSSQNVSLLCSALQAYTAGVFSKVVGMDLNKFAQMYNVLLTYRAAGCAALALL
jgi:hypothetical protein